MTLTKEWLQQTIAAMESQRDEAPFGISDDHDMTLAALKMALAGMESEPVITVGDDGGDALAYRRLIQTFAPGTKLYTAPQPLTTSERAELENYRNAQQVVPGERVAFESFMEKRLGDVVDRSRALNGDNEYMAWDMAVGWIAWQGRSAMQSGAVLSPMQPMVIDSQGTLRFKENTLVRKLLDVATAAGYGLNAMALEDHSPDDRMQLAQLIGYSLSGYGDLSYVSDESYNWAAAAAPKQEAKPL